MVNATIEWLESMICNTLQKAENNGLSVIRKNLAWEKWFQCNLFATMTVNNAEVYCESCMDDTPYRQGTRNDFLILNSDNSVTLMELKCRTACQTSQNTVGGFWSDIVKLSNVQANYRCCCVLLFEVKDQYDKIGLENQMGEVRARLGNDWKLQVKPINGVSNMYIAMACKNM